MILALCELLCAGLIPTKLDAQENAPAKPVMTLRVFENLIQIPVLVLTPKMQLMRPVPSKLFSVSLDSGPQFPATHVRFEGDDPIALSILIDVSSDEEGNAEELGRAIERLAPTSLQGHDLVSVYAFRNCEMWRVAHHEAADRSSLGSRIVAIYPNWPGGFKKQRKPECGRKLLLLGALTQVVHETAALPGRRVVLVLGTGEDRGSKQGWKEVASLAASAGVAVFGLKHETMQSAGFSSYGGNAENPYRTLCESTGGLVFSATSVTLRERLDDFMELLRKRYIVEFPRPDDIDSGQHSIQITIRRSNAFIRSTGISVPIADPTVLSDPNTLRTDPVYAPTVGKRKPLAGPQ